MSGELTRRDILGAGLVLAAYGGGLVQPAIALNTAALDMTSLTAATYKLLGQRPASPFFADKIFAHITGSYSAESLNALSAVVLDTAEADLAAALRDRGLDQMAADIANTWYSGTVFAGTDKAQVIGYVDNMAWQAVRFSTPQSVCGGHFGHWYKIPTGQ